jgi:alpha-amylase/alpha-mannosidase (GH57 family)
VRLHAVKDYLDMALRLEAHPRLKATFNFVPSLLDQIEEIGAGGKDLLFDALARPVADLTPAERAEVTLRCAQSPPAMRGRWPAFDTLSRRAQRATAGRGTLTDRELETLETWFLMAWLDPMFHDAPEAQALLGERGEAQARHRDALLGLYRRLAGDVVPAYRRLAERGQIELSTSPYAHPILPLLVDLSVARRALPNLHLPAAEFAAPEDATRQLARAAARHRRAFGTEARGVWPPEGSVSPEAVERIAREGFGWIASDEGVLWRSLAASERRREALYQPWRIPTPGGMVAAFFRDRELSDRIGFVYHHWEAADAVADFMHRLKQIGDEHGRARPAVVTVALDGENCWEHYADDGGPFLDRLYAALDAAPEIRTTTPSEVLERVTESPEIAHLHSGSWIDADFHIWIGHPEKNRAWDWIARARADLVASGADEKTAPGAWESLDAAEGSDWFWWFGTDHWSADKPIFDRILREHLAATYERRGAPAPAWFASPIVTAVQPDDDRTRPAGTLRPVLDGRVTSYYEWQPAGRRTPDSGGAMHQGDSGIQDLFYGFDAENLYVRVDPADAVRTSPGAGLELSLGGDRPAELRLANLSGRPPLGRVAADGTAEPLEGARVAVDRIVELGLPRASLGIEVGDEIRIEVRVTGVPGIVGGVSSGEDWLIRVPGPHEEAAYWSA